MAVMSVRSPEIDAIYITDELNRRPSKSTDYQKQTLALQAWAGQMVDRPSEVLSAMVDLAIDLCGGISGGISLWEDDPAPGVFRWHNLRGNLQQFTGGTTPREFSPCGMTLDLNGAVLARRPERVYTWLADAKISLAECLLVPLFLGGTEPVGTLWIVSEHEGHFDSGHARVMSELAVFAGIAMHMLRNQDRLKASLIEQETLAREMSHRVKNMFAIATALIRASEKSASTPAEMAQILSGRMEALATANALVRRNFDDKNVPQGADLGVVVRTILRPHERAEGASRFLIDGPEVQLGDRAVNGIALILHEFATNAAKYGALKDDVGSVDVKWQETDGQLVLDWMERGGPVIVAIPDRAGFGTKLSKSTVVGQFDGTLTYDWSPEGLKVTMSLPGTRLSH